VLSQGIREIEDPEKRVSSGGTITLPLIGSVMAAGKTLPQLVEDLHARFAEYIVHPMVDVSFAMDRSPGAVSPWGTVTVLGRVNQPGRISIPPTQDLTLSMAIQLAGGLDRSARDTAIRITRRSSDGGEMDVVDVNLRSAAVDGQTENDLLLQQGDIIYVPQKVF
jgi:polysaccharide export outer membrane protein